MRLVHKSTGVEVQINDKIEQGGDTVYVTGWEKPHNPASTGRIHVSPHEGLSAELRMTLGQSYYPNVFDCEWIEREDRAAAEAEMAKHPVGSYQNPRIISGAEMRAAYASERAERGDPYNERDGG